MRIKRKTYFISGLLALVLLSACAQPLAPVKPTASPVLATDTPPGASVQTPAETPTQPPAENPLEPTSPFVQITKVVTATITPKETPVNPSPIIPDEIDPNLEPLIQLAVKDLAGRLDIPPDQIEVLAAGAVVWSDPSMGCPAPGMRYIQLPQEGVLIRLQAGGQVYEYHSGGNQPPFLCENP